MTDKLLDGATIAVAALALVLGGQVALDRLGEPPSGDREIDNFAALVEDGRRIGPTNASVVLVEFGDYECPFCRSWTPRLDALMEMFPRDLAVVYRHLPLSAIHANAYQAARVAECAAAQGRFEETHAILGRLESLEEINAAELGAQVSMPDIPAFVDCTEQEGTVEAIERDLALASELGIRRTPTFVLDGYLFELAPDSLELVELVRSRVDELDR